MTDIVSGDNVILAIIASYLIQYLKDSQARALEWVTSEHPEVLRYLSAVVASLTAVGISVSFEAGVLTVTGLTIANLVNLLMTAVSQFVLQHSAFRLLISTPRRIKNGKRITTIVNTPEVTLP